jgi:2-oxoglutarate ferredoxin oxidoreductase subunit alpha
MIKGGYAVARAAISAGCRGYFGYPITPQSEIGEYMARYIFESGGVFVQAESEVAASAMLYGACASGVRAMTSSSGPGIALMQENISTMHMADCPVIVNMMRGGPGGAASKQRKAIIFKLSKAVEQEITRICVLTRIVFRSWPISRFLRLNCRQVRAPVFLLGDASLAQMMEEAVIPKPIEDLPLKLWAADGKGLKNQAG